MQTSTSSPEALPPRSSSPGEIQGLSTKSQLVLELIPQGKRWFQWAPQGNYPLSSKQSGAELLNNIHLGLHDQELILLKKLGLWIHPACLMLLSEKEIKALIQNEFSGGLTEKEIQETQELVKETIGANGFFIQEHVSLVRDFLKKNRLQDHPLFQRLSLPDQVSLWYWVLNLNKPKSEVEQQQVRNEAIEFALKHAQSPQDFADYGRAYLNLFSRLEDMYRNEKAIRMDRISDIVNELQFRLFPLLTCPLLPASIKMTEVSQHIRNYIMGGDRLGFPNLASGVAQVIRATNLNSPETVSKEIYDYIQKVNQLVLSHDLKPGKLSQDGQTFTYQLDTPQAYLELACSPEQEITLNCLISKVEATKKNK